MKELREGIDSASLQGFAPIKVQVTRGQGDTLARGSVKYIKRWMSDYVATGSPRVPMSPCQLAHSIKFGGERGIRTPGCLAAPPDFKSGAIDHSAISPSHSQSTLAGSAQADSVDYP